MAKIRRTKHEDFIEVTVDYATKKIRMDLSSNFVDMAKYGVLDSKCRVLLSKKETTQLIKALKSQRDRKGVK